MGAVLPSMGPTGRSGALVSVVLFRAWCCFGRVQDGDLGGVRLPAVVLVRGVWEAEADLP